MYNIVNNNNTLAGSAGASSHLVAVQQHIVATSTSATSTMTPRVFRFFRSPKIRTRWVDAMLSHINIHCYLSHIHDNPPPVYYIHPLPHINSINIYIYTYIFNTHIIHHSSFDPFISIYHDSATAVSLSLEDTELFLGGHTPAVAFNFTLSTHGSPGIGTNYVYH